MNVLTTIAIFVLAIPFSIWWLATVCGAIDELAPTRPLTRAVLGLIAVLLIALLIGPSILTPILWALGTVTALHVLSHWAMRNLALGAKNYDELSESLESDEVSH